MRLRHIRLRHAGTPAVVFALVVVAALTACSGGDKVAVKKLTAAEQLASAKAKADAATSMHLSLTSSGIPDTANGVLAAEGSGTHAPAFKGTLDARIAGFSAKVEVVAIDKLLYLKLPFTTEFTEVDPKDYNAPNPALLFAREGGVTSLMTATTNLVEGKATRSGADVLKSISGKLPGANIVKLLNFGDGAKTFDVTYGITDPGGELRSVTLVGPFFKSGTSTPVTSTYVLKLDKYGAPVEISKP
ncbi:MAG: LppX_LprAFG lipoprotein [Phycicoccus sp.]|nr:LppX_LprAFG lipoprotein [Phycicoccus sp.]NMM33625.1 LppX_LprAFG lipoprotein [Phycicoccus sp.]